MIKDDISEKLNEQLINVSRGEIRALSLDVLPRLIGALDERSDKCATCAELYDKSLPFVDSIVSVLRGTKEERKEFEHFVDNAFTHLQNEHKALPRGKILSVSVTTGMLLGLTIAILAGYFINGDLMGYGALGWLIGVTAGWIIGKVKEYNFKNEKRLF